MTLIAEEAIREAEERLVLLEKKAEYIEQEGVPLIMRRLLLIANVFMGTSLVLLILQFTL